MRLGVYSWNLVAFAEEWSTELGKVAPALAVGRFAPGVPVCQIVVPGAFYNWNGKEYARRTTTRPLVPMGTLRTRTGDEQLLVREASDFSVFTIDPKAEGEAWLKKSASPLAAGPAGKEYSRGVLHIPEPEMKAAFPPVVAAVGLMAFWDAANDNKPLRLAGRFSDKGSISNLVLLGPAGKETWRSEALDGRIGDVSFGDPKGEGREGLLVLTASNGGKERTIYFLTAS
jgi:hypothetical protein